jgi:glutamine synthetase
MAPSLMPKPFANQPGDGLHFYVPLWDGDTGLFDAREQDLSTLGRHFVAGVLYHSAALCALGASTVNSCQRLLVGETLSGTNWAPAFIAFGSNNRTAHVRTLRGRFEWRLPEAAANPYLYLVTAGLIVVGLDGIDRELETDAACSDDLFDIASTDIRARGIACLPQSLSEAVDAFESHTVLRVALGDTLHGQFVRFKRAMAQEHARQVGGRALARHATAI